MTARGTALRSLQQLDKGRIDRISDELDRARLEPRDAALARHLALGVVRNERFLDFALEQVVDRHLPKDPRTRAALRLGAYQLLLLEGMPPRAAVHETVALLQRDRAFANAVLRRLADRIAARSAEPDRGDIEVALSPTRTLLLEPPGLGAAVEPLALRHSLPDFLVRRWRARLGVAMTEQVAVAASAEPVLFLRACGGRSAAELVELLRPDGVRAAPTGHPSIVRCDGGAPFGSEAFRAGAFVAQDPTAVRAAEAVAAAPGMTIVDLCAAPGTKATLLAERVRPGGVVFAYDRDAQRRRRIDENARRLGLADVLRVVDDVMGLPRADAVLADVPCSNTGVLARRVEVRRRLREDTFAALAREQAAILTTAIGLVRAGGVVVHSTCSIEPEENEAVAESAAAATGAVVERAATTLPLAREHDGGFVAILRAPAQVRAAGVPGPLPAG